MDGLAGAGGLLFFILGVALVMGVVAVLGCLIASFVLLDRSYESTGTQWTFDENGILRPADETRRMKGRHP